jgi:cytochrome c-type biogenesis protein
VITLALAFVAGLLTVASPCVLPALPLVTASALSDHKLAPLALVGGLVTSFTIIGLLLAATGMALGIDDGLVRTIGAVLLLLGGLALLVPRLQQPFEVAASRLASSAARASSSGRWSGAGGHAVVGALLGAVWSPCVGPTLGAASGLAAQADTFPGAAIISAAFGVGAAVPLLAIAYGSRKLAGGRALALARVAKPAMASVLLVLGVAALSGADKAVEAAVLDSLPAWWLRGITRF